MAGNTRTLLIAHRDGTEEQVDIDKNCKVTFGPAVVGYKDTEKRTVPMALRIYEGKSDNSAQLAIFTDVVSFRDMAIPIRRKKINTQEKEGFIEFEGQRKATHFQAQTVEWVNPDNDSKAPETKQIEMPSDTEIFGDSNSAKVAEED